MSSKRKTAADVTHQLTDALGEISDRIDAELFLKHNPKEPLGPCVITFSRSGGAKGVFGFFKEEAWLAVKSDERVAEIAINPEMMALYGFVEVVSTLTHEKCHQWQYEFGEPSPRGYHNSEFAEKMRGVGLTPSHTGKPGGKQTGPKMSEFVTKGGPFEKFIKGLPKKLVLPFMGLSPVRQAKTSSGYLKYVCPRCKACVRGKPKLNIKCGTCDSRMFVN